MFVPTCLFNPHLEVSSRWIFQNKSRERVELQIEIGSQHECHMDGFLSHET